MRSNMQQIETVSSSVVTWIFINLISYNSAPNWVVRNLPEKENPCQIREIVQLDHQ
jgi:hypothetical protein